MKNSILLLLVLLYGPLASADAIDMRDYIILKNEISEAEVLYKFGSPDHETINTDYYNHIRSKTWFYIPVQSGSNKWITEFKFNGNGKLISKDRYLIR
ncbi:MAG: hypothetical protein D8M62_10490 [Proteobacteria bacterium]|nr:hypothetical protein [Pseudomonadota bacterium]